MGRLVGGRIERAAFALAICLAFACASYAQDATQDQGAPAKPMRIRIGGSVLPPKVTQYVTPLYPGGSQFGTIVLHVVIGTDGKIEELQYVSGPELLSGPAIDAVKQWTFEPTLLNGKEVEVDAEISVDFTKEPATKLIHQAMPKYPQAARDAGISGTVVLKAVIAKDGSVKDLQYASGPKELADSAIKAVKKWRYEPTKLKGEPVEVKTTISVVFNLP